MIVTFISNGRKYETSDVNEAKGILLASTGIVSIAKIKKRLIKNPKEYSNRIYNIVSSGIKENFELGRKGALGWPKMKRVSYVMRAMKGFPIQKYPVLHQTGALERGFQKRLFTVAPVGENTVVFHLSNVAPYASIQNEGGVQIAKQVKLKKQFTYKVSGETDENFESEMGRKPYTVLVGENESVTSSVARKYTREGVGKSKKIIVQIPARPFAFISDRTYNRLREEVFERVVAKEFESISSASPAEAKAKLNEMLSALGVL